MCKTYLIGLQVELTSDALFYDEDDLKSFFEEVIDRAQLPDEQYVLVDTAEILGYIEDD